MITGVSEGNEPGALVSLAPSQNFALQTEEPEVNSSFELFSQDAHVPLQIFLKGMSEFNQRMYEAESELHTLMKVSMQEGMWKENLGQLLSHNFGKVKKKHL